jgi:RNA polymerase sigma-70 factor (ECF subfamily)
VSPEATDERLSQIRTRWSLVLRACHGAGEPKKAAQAELLLRYGGAVYRYLLKLVADPEAAGDLCQEFALRFVRGDFHRAAPGRGRFRDFVKAAVVHLVADHRRRRQAGPRRVPLGAGPAGEPAGLAGDPRDLFEQLWKAELLDRAWEGMAREEEAGGGSAYTVLRLKAEEPGLTAAEIAARLPPRQGRPVTAQGVRQTLHRARERFALLLLDEVARSLPADTREEMEEELTALSLLPYCRPVLDRWARKG